MLPFLLLLLPLTSCSAEASKTTMIWDKSAHNAFTDLTFYHDQFYLVFRESDSHAAGENGKIRVLTSPTGSHWESEALITLDGIDLRDPKLSMMPDGRLILVMGGSVYEGESHLSMNTYVSFSKEGAHWTPPQQINIKGEWLWGITWHGGTAYGGAYSLEDLNDPEKPWTLKLYKTTDGLNYTYITTLDVTSYPNEMVIRFLDNDEMIALVRRGGNGWIGHAKPPYTTWSWSETDYRFGGQTLLIAPDGKIFAASRRVIKRWWNRFFGDPKCTVIFAEIIDGKYTPLITFPSGDDCGYPGLVLRDGTFYMSYYSSHEGDAKIYFAKFPMP